MPTKRYFPEVGDTVTVVVPVTAFYSRYAGRPELTLMPGMPAAVAHGESPYVRYHSCPLGCRNADTGVIVDYIDPASGQEERASLCYRNVVKLA